VNEFKLELPVTLTNGNGFKQLIIDTILKDAAGENN
jgi:hypothetical protein